MSRNRIQAVVDLEDRLTSKLGKVARSVRGFKSETDGSARSTSRWGGELDKVAGKVHKFFGDRTKSLVRGWFMSMKISAAVAMAGVSAAIGKAFKDYTEFESTLRNTTGLLAGAGMGPAQVEKAFNQFRDDIYRIAPKMAKAPQELANTLYDIVSGGFTGKGATDVLTAATKGASAGATDPAVVGNALVKTLSAYGYGAKEATQITDKMFQSVNLGIISFEELSQQLGDVVGLAATAKVPFSDLMASIAVMTRKGLVPAEAFTSLNQMMLSIMAPGVQEQEAANAIFGKDVKNQWSAQALAAKGLSGVMEGLMSKLNPSPDQIKRMNSMNAEVADLATAEVAGDKLDVLTSLFGNVRALRGALVLASKDGYTFADAQKDMAGSAGATDKVLAEQRKTVKFQLDQLKSYANVFGLQVMQDIAPEIGKKTKELSRFFNNVMESADYKNAKGMGKVKVLGQAIWDAISKWWEQNKAAVSKNMSKGIDWLAGTVVPFVTRIGIQIGEALVPAIWKGLMNTAPGRGLVAAVALSWGAKLGNGMIPGVTGAGGAGGIGGAGGTGAGGMLGGPGSTIQMAAGTAIAIVGAVLAINEARVTYNRVVKEVTGAQKEEKKNLGKMTPEQLAEAEKRAKHWDMGRVATEIWGLLPGRTTPLQDVHHAQSVNRQRTTANTINDYSKTGLLPALAKLWNSPDKNVLARVLSNKDRGTWMDKNNLTASAFRTGEVQKLGDFSTIMKQYSEDPKKLSEAQRTAVEFLIANTKDTVGAIGDSADGLYNQGLSQQAFSDALVVANPILADVGLKTQEWALRLTAAKQALDSANAWLSTHNGLDPFGQFPGAPTGGIPPTRDPDKGPRPNSPTNPNGARPNDPTGPVWVIPGTQTNVPPTRDPDRGRGPRGSRQAVHMVQAEDGSWVDANTYYPKAHKNALGSRGIVNKPTLFLAGESGAENFSFTPHFKGGVDKAGGGRTVHINAPLVGEIKVDPEGMSVAEVAEKIADLVLDVLENGA